MKLVKVATCNLNQWAMDFAGNKDRIIASIQQAVAQGCKYRIGPELEISGYSCEDHFLEMDTYTHSWEVLAEILPHTQNILADIGMGVVHDSVTYNCRVYCVNGKIVLIRPKKHLAADGNYRECRHFAAWRKHRETEAHILPSFIQAITGQTNVPFGDGIVLVEDILVGTETCEELFTPNSPHIALSLAGVDIIGNGSGSHHNLRKLHQRIGLITEATAKGGGVYLYANQQGCDGNRLYFDGCALVSVNGNVVAQGTQFSLHDVEVVTAVVDIDQVRSYRVGIPSRAIQATDAPDFPQAVVTDFSLVLSEDEMFATTPNPPVNVKYLSVEEEIALGPACWLWDYLTRSKMAGFFLPLSGGADSSSTAALVGCMCQLVVKACNQNGIADAAVLENVRRLVRDPPNADPSLPGVQCEGIDGKLVTLPAGYVPRDPRELAGRIFYTCYMGTKNSSSETRQRAEQLAREIGANHKSVVIDSIVDSFSNFFADVTNKTPKFKFHGGSDTEDIALQNIQARTRMVVSYLMAQLITWAETDNQGTLLVLGSANVDEALRGYLTKYDCSSADINPIGGVSKSDLKKFLVWASKEDTLGYPSLATVVSAVPTAELRPIKEGESLGQSDEADMGMTYDELRDFGTLRKVHRCGPVSMFQNLLRTWSDRNLSPTDVAEKVKRFFRFYSINRHKLTVLTPSYHAENYSPEDNRFDLRQFLYNVRWPWQFNKIDEIAAKVTKHKLENGDEPSAKKRRTD